MRKGRELQDDMVRLMIVMTVLAGAALAACGSSGSSSTGAADTSPATSTTSTRTATATATATATVTTSASTQSLTTTSQSTGSPTAGQPCLAAHLSGSFIGGQGATGHGELGFALRNIGTTTCHTYGYPGIQFQDAGGGSLPTTPQHTTSDFFGSLPLKPVTVAPGQSFSFRLGVSHGSGSASGCSTAHAVAIIAPDDTIPIRVPIPQTATECGTTTVSPVQPGLTAYR